MFSALWNGGMFHDGGIISGMAHVGTGPHLHVGGGAVSLVDVVLLAVAGVLALVAWQVSREEQAERKAQAARYEGRSGKAGRR